MEGHLDANLRSHLDPNKRGLYIEAFTLLFYVILPNLSERMIVEQWEARGTLPRPSLRACLANCLTEPPPEYFDIVHDNEDEFIECVIKNAFLTDDCMDKYLPESVLNLDNRALRSQRARVLTHPETVACVMARREAPRKAREEREKKREEHKNTMLRLRAEMEEKKAKLAEDKKQKRKR